MISLMKVVAGDSDFSTPEVSIAVNLFHAKAVVEQFLFYSITHIHYLCAIMAKNTPSRFIRHGNTALIRIINIVLWKCRDKQRLCSHHN